MKSTVDLIFKCIEIILVLCIVMMAIMVFGNVVLRYGFNSGITISEEASRMLFVWLTFTGAVVAMKEKAHIGVDTLVKRLPPGGKKFCAILSNLLIIGCCWLFFTGSLEQTKINLSVEAPVTRWPMAIFYGVGLICSSLIGVLVVINLFKLITGRVDEKDLISVHESQELAEFEARQKAGQH